MLIIPEWSLIWEKYLLHQTQRLLKVLREILANQRFPRSQATSEKISKTHSYMFLHRFILVQSGKEISKRLQFLNFIPFHPQH